jgi:hypothetical protein
MAFQYSTEVFDALNGDNISVYNFIDIWLDGPIYQDHPLTYFPDIHLCDWIRYIPNVYTPGRDGVSEATVNYEPELFKGMEPPPKTGNVSQEIQRIIISQPLGREEDPAEFVVRLGNRYHGATIRIRSFVELENELLVDSINGNPTPGDRKTPVVFSDGIIKSISRSHANSEMIIEFTNSYGKLDSIKSLRTTEGSIKKFDVSDTSFNAASIDITQRLIEWGT